MAGKPPNQWATKYKECKGCGRTTVKHKGYGFCTSCYGRKAESIKENEKAKRKKKTWAKEFKKCKGCGTTKVPHRGRGFCVSCYSGLKGAEERAKERKEKHKNTVYPKRAESKERKIRGRPREWTKERIEQEAEDLLEWSLKDEALVLEEFGLYRNPPYIRKQMYDLAEQNKNFAHALLVSKERVRSRRDKGATSGIYNPSMVQFTHSFYDRDNQLENQSFTLHQKEKKAVDDHAEISKMSQAVTESSKYIDEAEEMLEKEKKEGKK